MSDYDPTLAMGPDEEPRPDATLAEGAGAPAVPAREAQAASDSCPLIRGIEIEGILGRGGQGVVYRGRQSMLDRPVAVKLLDASSTSTFQERFRREAKILAAIVHPHIVSCYQADVTDDGHSYMVMEFIDGPDLFRWVKERGPLGVADALTVGRDVAEALRHALEDYDESVIHRDVKPHNVLLQPLKRSDCPFPFQAKVADLGLARSTSEDSEFSNLTVAGSMLGTPATMAPEQFDDPDEVDFRADIYGLGCVLYHALVGQMPFQGKSISQIFKLKTLGEVPDPADKVPGLPRSVADLLLCMLHPDRGQRPQSYALLIETIDHQLAVLGGSCTETESLDEGDDGGGKKLRWPVPIGAAGIALIGYLAVWEDAPDGAPDELPVTTAASAPDAATLSGAQEAEEEISSDPGAPALAPGERRLLIAELAGGDSGAWEGWSLDPPRSEPPDSMLDIWTLDGEELIALTDGPEGVVMEARGSVPLPSGAWILAGKLSVRHMDFHADGEQALATVRIDLGDAGELLLRASTSRKDRKCKGQWFWSREGVELAQGDESFGDQAGPLEFTVVRTQNGDWSLQLGPHPPQAIAGLRGAQGELLELSAANSQARWRDLELVGR